jgi:arabinofuranan 3-O-arabinosyltransferase
VVRNDLDPAVLGYISPQIVNETLALSGFERAASFGPRIVSSPSYLPTQPTAPGQAPGYPAVEIFQAVNPAWRPAGPVTALSVSDTVLVNGGPDSLPALAGQGVVTSQPAVIAGDPLPVRPDLWAITDGQRRADNAFSLTTQNMSFTYTATETDPPDDALGGAGGPPRQVLPVPAAGHQTVAVLSGAAQVTASSYGYWLAQSAQYDPVNAFDDNPATAWAEGTPYTPVGQWIQISFDRTLDLPATIGIQLLAGTPSRSAATQVRVSTAAGDVTTNLADTGARQALRAPPGPTSWLRITITGAGNVVPGAPGAGFASVLIPGVKVTRYLQPAEDPAGTAAASTVYSFHQQAASPATVSGPPASQVLARTFQAAAAQRVSMTATAVATPGAALDRLISSLVPASRSTFQVTASSTWDSLPQYSPDNLFSSASSTPWVASSADPNPLLRVTWRGIRTIGELVLSPAPGSAAFPASVEVASPQGARLASVGQGGVVRLVPPLRTNQLDVTFPDMQPVATTVGGQPGQLPIGLSKLTIPGLAGLRVAAPSGQAGFRLACGQGPTVSIDGKSYPTAVSGTAADLNQFLPVQVRLCAPGGQLALSAGRHWLLATPSSVFAITDLDMRTQPGAAAASSAQQAAVSGGQRPVQVLTWQADNRSLSIGPGAESYVEVHENFNAGWAATLNGRPLTAVRLDGWQQAFIVSAGQGGVIRLSYAPATVYHAGLIVSALALVVLVALATGLGRRRDRGHRRQRWAAGVSHASGPRQASGPHPGWQSGRNGPRVWERGRPAARMAAVFVPLAVVIWLAGGPAVIAVPVLAGLAWWRPRWLPPIAFGAMLTAGVAAASSSNPPATGSGAFGGLAQACALVALTAALMPAVARTAAGPADHEADREERGA